MTPPLSDCCTAPASDDLIPHTVPGVALGRCSACSDFAMFAVPKDALVPRQPGRHRGLLIGIAIFMSLASGVSGHRGPGWLTGLTGVTAVLCWVLAYKKDP